MEKIHILTDSCSDIPRPLAERLGIAFYDKELIEMAAKESGIDQDILRDYDEKPTNSFLYSLSLGAYSYGNSFTGMPEMPIVDKVFSVQSDIIKSIAEKEPAVIVGRCAENILRGHDNLLSVFVHADFDYRIRRICEYENITHDAAAETIRRADKKRASYHNYFSDAKWGVATTYDVCVNSSLGLDLVTNMICTVAQERL